MECISIPFPRDSIPAHRRNTPRQKRMWRAEPSFLIILRLFLGNLNLLSIIGNPIRKTARPHIEANKKRVSRQNRVHRTMLLKEKYTCQQQYITSQHSSSAWLLSPLPEEMDRAYLDWFQRELAFRQIIIPFPSMWLKHHSRKNLLQYEEEHPLSTQISGILC